jgi:hypothetical protein
MGTCHLVCVYHKGCYAIAEYGHCDGYPRATGVQILKFLTPTNIDKLQKGLQFIKVYDGYDEDDKAEALIGILGANVLDEVAEASDSSTSVEVGMDLKFASNSLFCEWVYVVDLDSQVLEVYQGDGISSLVSRTKTGKGHLIEADVCGQIYKASFGFAELPHEAEFVKTCNAEMDED